jgi:hypothetical protein
MVLPPAGAGTDPAESVGHRSVATTAAVSMGQVVLAPFGGLESRGNTTECGQADSSERRNGTDCTLVG